MQVRAMKMHLQALLRKGGNDDRLIAMLQAIPLICYSPAYSRGLCTHKISTNILMQYILMATPHRLNEVTVHPLFRSRNVHPAPCCIFTKFSRTLKGRS